MMNLQKTIPRLESSLEAAGKVEPCRFDKRLPRRSSAHQQRLSHTSTHHHHAATHISSDRAASGFTSTSFRTSPFCAQHQPEVDDTGCHIPSTTTPVTSSNRIPLRPNRIDRRGLIYALAMCVAASHADASTAASTAPSSTEQKPEQLDAYLDTLMTDLKSKIPPELRELDALMALEEDAVDGRRLEAARLKNGFKRSPDGRVFVRTPKGKWFNVKNDAYVEGYLLLQDSSGLLFYLPPGDVADLQQVDLSDDMVVAMLFSSGEWAKMLRPLDMEVEGGGVQQARLSEGDFREALSFLVEAGSEGQQQEQQ